MDKNKDRSYCKDESKPPLGLFQKLPYELQELILVGSLNPQLALTCRSFHRMSQQVVVIAKQLLFSKKIWSPWGLLLPQSSDHFQCTDAPVVATTQQYQQLLKDRYYPKDRIQFPTTEQWISIVEDPQFTHQVAVCIFDMHMDDDALVEIVTENAAMHGRLELMEWLLVNAPTNKSRLGTSSNGSIDMRDRLVSTAFRDNQQQLVSAMHSTTLSDPLQQKQPFLGLSQRLKDSALVQSCLFGHLQVASLLLVKGKANSAFDVGASLSMASKYGHLNCVKLLLESGAVVNGDDNYALCWASRHGYTPIVQLLLDAGADINARRGCALNWAAEHGHDSTVKLLIQYGADIHSNDDYALRWSCVRGQVDVVQLLLAAGADVHAVQDFPLRNAVKFGHVELVKLLVQNGADVRACEDEAIKWVMQHNASEWQSEMIQILCNAANQDLTLEYKRLPLNMGTESNSALFLDADLLVDQVLTGPQVIE
ncbi:hypothetical protein BDV3_003573 [Batrachochytrium dendrobatidis]